MSFHLWHSRTSRQVRYQPEFLPLAIDAWLLAKSLSIRLGNPYLTKEEALVVAVHEFTNLYPDVKGTLRRNDGTVIATTANPALPPVVTFRTS